MRLGLKLGIQQRAKRAKTVIGGLVNLIREGAFATSQYETNAALVYGLGTGGGSAGASSAVVLTGAVSTRMRSTGAATWDRIISNNLTTDPLPEIGKIYLVTLFYQGEVLNGATDLFVNVLGNVIPWGETSGEWVEVKTYIRAKGSQLAFWTANTDFGEGPNTFYVDEFKIEIPIIVPELITETAFAKGYLNTDDIAYGTYGEVNVDEGIDRQFLFSGDPVGSSLIFSLADTSADNDFETNQAMRVAHAGGENRDFRIDVPLEIGKKYHISFVLKIEAIGDRPVNIGGWSGFDYFPNTTYFSAETINFSRVVTATSTTGRIGINIARVGTINNVNQVVFGDFSVKERTFDLPTGFEEMTFTPAAGLTFPNKTSDRAFGSPFTYGGGHNTVYTYGNTDAYLPYPVNSPIEGSTYCHLLRSGDASDRIQAIAVPNTVGTKQYLGGYFWFHVTKQEVLDAMAGNTGATGSNGGPFINFFGVNYYPPVSELNRWLYVQIYADNITESNDDMRIYVAGNINATPDTNPTYPRSAILIDQLTIGSYFGSTPSETVIASRV